MSLLALTRELAGGPRSAWRSRFTSIAVIVILAVGIGATVAVFAFLDAQVLRKLPYGEPSRLVQIERSINGRPLTAFPIPYFLQWQSANSPLASVAAFNPLPTPVQFEIRHQPRHLSVLSVSASFFRTLGVQPALGRRFSAAPRSGHPEMIISNAAWQRWFNGSSSAVGAQFNWDGQAFTIVGVAPASFNFWPAADAWLATNYATSPVAHSVATNVIEIIGRLLPGRTATATTQSLTAGSAALISSIGVSEQITVEELQKFWTSKTRQILAPLQLAALFLFLICCLNATGLLLAREEERTAANGIRAALGASPGRLARAIVAECLWLAFCGAIAAIGVALLVAHLLTALVPSLGLGVTRPAFDLRLLAAGIVLAIVAAVLAAAIPAWRVARCGPMGALRQSVPGSSSVRRKGWRSGVPVAVEVALACLLVAGVVLSAEAALRLSRSPLGFSPRDVTTAQISFPPSEIPTAAALSQRLGPVLQSISSLPGVAAAAAAANVPATPAPSLDFAVPSQPGLGLIGAWFNAVSPRYFQTFNIRVLRGRGFRASDSAAAQPVAILSARLAQTIWTDRSALGKYIWVGKGLPGLAERQPRAIVGIVDNIKQGGPASLTPDYAFYIPLAQMPAPVMHLLFGLAPPYLVARTYRSNFQIAQSLTKAAYAATAVAGISQPKTMQSLVNQTIGPYRLDAGVLALFGMLAVLLSALGLYALLAGGVARRRLEFGTRMALGARPAELARGIVRSALALAAIGAAAGTLAAACLARYLGSVLVGIQTSDWRAYAIAPAVLLAVALLSSLIPARRAARSSPADLFRCG